MDGWTEFLPILQDFILWVPLTSCLLATGLVFKAGQRPREGQSPEEWGEIPSSHPSAHPPVHRSIPAFVCRQSKGSGGQLEWPESLPEGSEGLQEGSDGQLEGSEGLTEGPEGLPGDVTDGQR